MTQLKTISATIPRAELMSHVNEQALKPICGAATVSGTACRQTILPCPRHTPGFKRRPKTSVRKERLIEGIMQGKSRAAAAREAGYSEKSIKGTVGRILKSPDAQALLRQRRQDTHLHTEEIIGTLAQHMRGDIAEVLPDIPLLKEAKKRGVSHLIKKVDISERSPNGTTTRTRIELYDSQKAATRLVEVYGLKNLPIQKESARARFNAAVQEFMQVLADAGDALTRQEAEDEMLPYFERDLREEAEPID